MTLRALLVLAAIALLGWLLRPGTASAHAVLTASYPSAGAVLRSPPDAVRLWFSEPIQHAGQSIVVTSPSGRAVAAGPIHNEGLDLSVALAVTERGTYLVRWSVIAYDTHPTSGSFTFSVGHAGGIFAGTNGSTGGDVTLGTALQVAAHWLHFVGYALGFGSVAFLLLVVRPGTGPQRGIVPSAPGMARLGQLVAVGIVTLVLAEPLALLAETASLGAGRIFNATMMTAVLASRVGLVLAQQLGAALALWALAGALRAGAAKAAPAILALGLALAVVDGEASHAVATQPVWLALAVNAAHVAAMGVWVGGLVALLALWPLVEPSGRGAIVARFGRLAAAALAILATTGALLAWQHLARPTDLVTTAYGRTLMAKTIVLCAVVALALIGVRSHRVRSTRWWRLELAAFLGVLALAGLMIGLPPPA